MRPQELVGTEVYDPKGERVGKVATVYLSEESQQPEWVTVHTGLFGHKESFVPLAGAQSATDGLHVNWGKDKIKEAPRIDADGHLSAQESMNLYDYYGIPVQRAGEPGGQGQRGKMPQDRQTQKQARGGQQGRQDEQVMTRSEEQLKVGTQRVETGRVRLRKHVVTEEQQVTVPVSHEEIRIEREPVDPRRAGKTEIGEDEQEIVLHADKPVVAKESVPVEQVRVRTEEVTEQQQIRDKVRKEQIDVDQPRPGSVK
ncbi:DUF2382 domain-containing protein [Kibdelosporangium phytohabitans]|uniref:Photosystem reaction center subunit H n=1 Tax=Kibdelosporangium phytohabitans TaxID=860235 RepID=A0A0N7F4W1_9PSEU|nr:PRC and DUF2382 domain-containing protein [Kibdelosporangium phytohabitans]ALG12535.1 hypothetical protein AOZ06_41795 [Kibdelosporangium phytohabitans]MBE1464140.1 uncharacterized protein (TIGR02271 family) [Kibdelosporangium phytohabitans]